jgi:AcrR family transcriptional regulator
VSTERAQDGAPPVGLRDRKKAATREALSLATLRLAKERGLENVRVEDIAAEVGVSPRTFNNYFSSKYDAIATRHLDRMRKAADGLRARPADEPLWQAIFHVMEAFFGGGGVYRAPEKDALASTRLMLSEPALQAEVLKAGMAADSEFAAAVAWRTGTDPGGDLYPRLVAAAVTTAVQVATDQWLRADPPVPLSPLLHEALRQLAAGLPDPSVDR